MLSWSNRSCLQLNRVGSGQCNLGLLFADDAKDCAKSASTSFEWWTTGNKDATKWPSDDPTVTVLKRHRINKGFNTLMKWIHRLSVGEILTVPGPISDYELLGYPNEWDDHKNCKWNPDLILKFIAGQSNNIPLHCCDNINKLFPVFSFCNAIPATLPQLI